MQCQLCRILAVVLFLITSLPAFAVTADQAADDFIKDLWRRYKTAPSLVIIVNSRSIDSEGAVKDFGRQVIFCSERGELRVTTPSNSWVSKKGQVYSDSKFFPGTYISNATGSNSAVVLKSMESMWPMTQFPVDLHLRLASSWQEAFRSTLDRIGPEGTVTVEEGKWAEDTPASIVRFRSADGSFQHTLWVDTETNLLRGSLLEDASGYVTSVSEPEIRARLGQEVRFATAGREGFKDFKSLSAQFDKAYSMPTPSKAKVAEPEG